MAYDDALDSAPWLLPARKAAPACDEVVVECAPPKVEVLVDVLVAPPKEPVGAAELGPPSTALVPDAEDAAVELPPALPAITSVFAKPDAVKPISMADTRRSFYMVIRLVENESRMPGTAAICTSVAHSLAPTIESVKVINNISNAKISDLFVYSSIIEQLKD